MGHINRGGVLGPPSLPILRACPSRPDRRTTGAYQSAWRAYAAILLGFAVWLTAVAVCAAPDPVDGVLIIGVGVKPPPAADLAGVDVLVLPALCGGCSGVDPAPEPFALLGYRWTPAQLGALVGEYHGQGIKVVGDTDLLRWADPADGSGLFGRHPELFELDSRRSCGTPEEPNRFASIWHPEVTQILARLAQGLGGGAKALDGLLVHFGYSARTWLGYSTEARVAYIRAHHRDPADLWLSGQAPQMRAEAEAWVTWRQSEATRVLSEFLRAYRLEQAEDLTFAWADPAVYRMHSVDRGKPCSEWVTWLAKGIVDGVFLEGPWIASATEEGLTPPRLYAAALGLLSRMDPLPMFVPTIPTEFAGEEVDIAAQLAQLRSEGPVPALGIVVRKPEHLEAALEALRNFEPDEI